MKKKIALGFLALLATTSAFAILSPVELKNAKLTTPKVTGTTASHVLVNDGSGYITSEATLAKSRGGTGADNSSVTFPSSGTIVTEAGTQALTNKTFNGALNTAVSIADSSLNTITTAGKVANSATSATISATANTIALRTSEADINAEQFIGGDGSASNPSFALSGASNSGMYRFGASPTIGFTTNGTLRALISDSGVTSFVNGFVGDFLKPNNDATAGIQFRTNGGTSIMNIDTLNSRVGIGNVAPTKKLDVTGDFGVSGAATLSTSVITPIIKPAADSTTALQVQTSGGSNILNVDTTNSRIGVGTTSPNSRIESRVSRSDATNNNALTLSDNLTGVATVGYGTRINWLSNNNAVEAAIGFENGGDGTNNQSQLGFYTQTSAGNLTRKMTVAADGRVGVGTAIPDSIFEVHSAGVAYPSIGARLNDSNGRISFGGRNANGDMYLGYNINPVASSNNQTYDLTGQYAAMLQMNSGAFTFNNTSTSGTAGNTVTWSQPLTISNAGASTFNGTVRVSNANSGTYLELYNSSAAAAGGQTIELPFTYLGTGGGTFTNWKLISRYAGGNFELHSGATPQVIVTNTGSMGVGVSPTLAASSLGLHVNSTNTQVSTKLTNSSTGATATDGLDLYMDASNSYLVQREAMPLILGTSNTDRITIGTTGLVGIGAASGGDALHVSGNNGATFIAANDTAAERLVIKTSAGTGQMYVGVEGSTANGIANETDDYSAVISSAGSGQSLYFATTGTTRVKIDANGHIKYKGNGSAPAVSSCGTTPSISGNDVRGSVTFGTGTVTACTLTFNTTYGTAPVCVVSTNGSGAFAFVTSTSTTTLVIGTSANFASGVVHYMCIE